MATLRKLLTKAGFDWEDGVIIWHITPDDREPGYSWAESRTRIGRGHEILDQEFDDEGAHGADMPRFFARDGEKVYFPSQYDGRTWITAVHVDPEHYLTPGVQTPYPGGG